MDYQILAGLLLILATILVLGYSGVIIYSHKVTAFDGVRKLLVAVCILLAVRAALEALKFGPSFPDIAEYYVTGVVITGSLMMLAITTATIGIYSNSSEAGIRRLIKVISGNRIHKTVIYTATVYGAILVGLLITKPFNLVDIGALSGGKVISTIFKQSYELLLVPAIALFAAYGVALTFLASKRTDHGELKDSLHVICLSWAEIGSILVIFNLYQSIGGIDLNGLSLLIISCIFSFTALGFNKASVLGGFLDYKPESPMGTRTASFSFSKRLKKGPGFLCGKQFLLESEVGNIESQVRDFCFEQISCGEKVFVVTNLFSPLYKAISKYSEIRFCLFSQKVSRPEPSGKQNEILIPQDGIATILYVIEKVAYPEGRKTIVFDNLTDIFVTLGHEKAQKFLMTANEYMAENKATALFLVHPDGLEPRVTNWIRSLYANILTTSHTFKPVKMEN